MCWRWIALIQLQLSQIYRSRGARASCIIAIKCILNNIHWSCEQARTFICASHLFTIHIVHIRREAPSKGRSHPLPTNFTSLIYGMTNEWITVVFSSHWCSSHRVLCIAQSEKENNERKCIHRIGQMPQYGNEFIEIVMRDKRVMSRVLMPLPFLFANTCHDFPTWNIPTGICTTLFLGLPIFKSIACPCRL